MNTNSNVKRRPIAARQRSEEDSIDATGPTSPEVPDQDTAEEKYRKDKSRRQQSQAQRDQYIRHDRETNFFYVLATLGAAFVVVAFSTFSTVFEEDNKLGIALGRVMDRLPFVPDRMKSSSNGTRHEFLDPTTNETDAEAHTYRPTFSGTISPSHVSTDPPMPDNAIIEDPNATDFGGLDLNFTVREYIGTTRQIRNDPMQMISDFRDFRTAGRDDDYDEYYAHDDDYVRNPLKDIYVDYDDDPTDGLVCRRTSEHRLYFPNCNSFHETPFLESEAEVIGEGAYRQTMSIENSFAQEKETVVVKDIHLSYHLGHEMYEFSRMDAVVAERLSASPRIYDIYGACGIGIMAEYFPHGQIEQIALPEEKITMGKESDPLISHNDLSAMAKLKVSLHMAESLADLHGFPGGVIVHQDVKLDQFFLSADKSEVILNDFNRAEFMLWDQQNGEYCKYTEGGGGGNWRAPEEYHDEYLTESVDVFSLGNNMYSLLTGMMPFHEIGDYQEVGRRVGDGEKAYIDPRYKERSLAEAKLVEIIEKCHEYWPEDRPSIFEVINFLWDAIEEVHHAMMNEEEDEDEYEDRS